MIKIPKGFYDNIKYKVDIIITGEAMDTRVRAANMMMAMQAMQSDPSILQDPTKKAFFFGLLEQAGINPYDFVSQQTPTLEGEIQKGGGGISKPSMPNTAMGGPTQNTI